MTTTIKVTPHTRDRLKSQAAAAHRTLGEHLELLADLADKVERMESLRRAVLERPRTPEQRREDEAWEGVDLPHDS